MRIGLLQPMVPNFPASASHGKLGSWETGREWPSQTGENAPPASAAAAAARVSVGAADIDHALRAQENVIHGGDHDRTAPLAPANGTVRLDHSARMQAPRTAATAAVEGPSSL